MRSATIWPKDEQHPIHADTDHFICIVMSLNKANSKTSSEYGNEFGIKSITPHIRIYDADVRHFMNAVE
jgi:hypothetical protein